MLYGIYVQDTFTVRRNIPQSSNSYFILFLLLLLSPFYVRVVLSKTFFDLNKSFFTM